MMVPGSRFLPSRRSMAHAESVVGQHCVPTIFAFSILDALIQRSIATKSPYPKFAPAGQPPFKKAAKGKPGVRAHVLNALLKH
jgi:hypothetical protein